MREIKDIMQQLKINANLQEILLAGYKYQLGFRDVYQVCDKYDIAVTLLDSEANDFEFVWKGENKRNFYGKGVGLPTKLEKLRVLIERERHKRLFI